VVFLVTKALIGRTVHLRGLSLPLVEILRRKAVLNLAAGLATATGRTRGPAVIWAGVKSRKWHLVVILHLTTIHGRPIFENMVDVGQVGQLRSMF
jgi:hypothetical protein